MGFKTDNKYIMAKKKPSKKSTKKVIGNLAAKMDIEEFAIPGMFEMPDMVKEPPHYKGTILPNNIECIDVAQHFNFNKGTAIKYIWRAGHKGGEIEDLKKAIQYLEFEIELLQSPRRLRNNF